MDNKQADDRVSVVLEAVGLKLVDSMVETHHSWFPLLLQKENLESRSWRI